MEHSPANSIRSTGLRRRCFACNEAGQLSVQLGQAFALPHPLGRGVAPARVLGTEFVAPAQLLQGLPGTRPGSQGLTQVAVGLGTTGLERDSLPVLGDGSVELAL